MFTYRLQRYKLFMQIGQMNCERNKKSVFIRNLVHKYAFNEQFLSNFASDLEKLVL